MSDGEGDGIRRVLHIDDSPQMRHWLELAVQSAPDLRVVGAAGDGLQGVELAGRLHPDVIVLDQSMPHLDGIDALPMLREAAPNAVVVMWCNDPFIKERALDAGAVDVVDKASPIDLLMTALRTVPAPRRSAD
jgi:DNA-binding NarL/FixJ family response regulator